MDDRYQSAGEYGSIGRETPAHNAPAHAPPTTEPALASVVLGAVFALAAAPTTQLIHTLWSSHFQGFGRLAEGAAAVFGIVGVLFILACAGLGLAFGINGITAAKREDRSIALGLAGLLLNVADLAIWLGILICWLVAILGRP